MTRPERKAPFSYEGLDRAMHEKARLGLLTSLMAHPKGLAFADLKQLCALTDGNLSRHLQVLHDSGLVEIIKGYERNRPHTKCRLTPRGRRAGVARMGQMQDLCPIQIPRSPPPSLMIKHPQIRLGPGHSRTTV